MCIPVCYVTVRSPHSCLFIYLFLLPTFASVVLFTCSIFLRGQYLFLFLYFLFLPFFFLSLTAAAHLITSFDQRAQHSESRQQPLTLTFRSKGELSPKVGKRDHNINVFIFYLFVC
uniref:Uncharacterized protein n=1 Tax=Trypanosoma congolense (strain IL3000) TaxID=1068625 RepID=G0UMI1_TRYCI|nr:hypothetical protein, unlikely [Trypanosoma congolense IL3000]